MSEYAPASGTNLLLPCSAPQEQPGEAPGSPGCQPRAGSKHWASPRQAEGKGGVRLEFWGAEGGGGDSSWLPLDQFQAVWSLEIQLGASGELETAPCYPPGAWS